MSRQKVRRIVIDLGRNGSLDVTDPLGLIGKTVTVTLTNVTVQEADIKASSTPNNASAEIVCAADSAVIAEVP